MYKETQSEEENLREINLKIKIPYLKFPYDRNTAIGFCIGTPIALLLIYLLVLYKDIEPETRSIKYNIVPVAVLNFGRGDGTGMSKGNLSAEGVAHKGATPQSSLHDAEIAANTKTSKVDAETDISTSSNLKPVGEVSGNENSKDKAVGNSNKNVGTKDGSESGTGLGSKGFGRGLGEGFGDIEWGGGGNRFVLVKKPPKYPKGVNTTGTIKIKFRVRKDGTISSMVPLQKADPALERAAMDALRQWRFNPIDQDIEMEGIIPFNFRLR